MQCKGAIEEVDLGPVTGLETYAEDVQLSLSVRELKTEARVLAAGLKGRRVWMINSTAQGGGVAEMLPRLVSLLSELGVETHWLVMQTERQEFFPLTKHLHNLIHGSGDPTLTPEDKQLYDQVSEEVADALVPLLAPDDILVCHDPQPAGACALAAKRVGCRSVWRCHIGLDDDLPQTQAAWSFLQPYIEGYDHWVFSAPEYIPHYLSSHVSVIFPALDPLSHKNRGLSVHKLAGILSNAGLVPGGPPVVTSPFESPVLRLQPDGRWTPCQPKEDLELLFRPVVTQVSRWDRLKGWRPLLDAFAAMKERVHAGQAGKDERSAQTLQLVRLVLAGPEPAAVQDDPEAVDVLDEMVGAYRELSPAVQRDVALLSLPMASRKHNALIVNALQRCSSLVVQNSLREGFGLTVSEAMWKRVAVLGSTACGIRQQVRHGVDGHLNPEAEDSEGLSHMIEDLLVDPVTRSTYAKRGQLRVASEFLVFKQVSNWMRALSKTVEAA